MGFITSFVAALSAVWVYHQINPAEWQEFTQAAGEAVKDAFTFKKGKKKEKPGNKKPRPTFSDTLDWGDTKPKAKPKDKPKAKPEAKPKAKAKAKPKAKPEVNPEAKPEAK